MHPSLHVHTTFFLSIHHLSAFDVVNGTAMIRDVQIPTKPPTLSSLGHMHHLEILGHKVILFNFLWHCNAVFCKMYHFAFLTAEHKNSVFFISSPLLTNFQET